MESGLFHTTLDVVCVCVWSIPEDKKQELTKMDAKILKVNYSLVMWVTETLQLRGMGHQGKNK